MDENEIQRYMQDMQERLSGKIESINSLQAELDMTILLLEKVAERTENYREYFFSRKMLDDKRREIHSKSPAVDLADVDSSFAALDRVAEDLSSLVTIAKKEVERLDN